MKKRIIIFLLLIFISVNLVSAATYYVCDGASACNSNSTGWATGNNANNCASKALPCKTIRGGIAKMTGGDTLIIGDGNYTGIENMMSTEGWNYDLPSGTAQQYTTIKGENYLGAVMDGEFNYRPIHLDGESYIIFQNLYLRNAETWRGAGGSNFRADYSDHIKVLDMAAENGWGKFWFRYCKYILVEDCFAWGKGTYYYFFGGEYGNYQASQYNVVRRSVARRDCHLGESGGNHYSAFVSYWGDNTYFQNDISVDAIPGECGDPNSLPPTMAVFYTANGGSNYNADGCISAGDEGQIGQFESGASPVALRNNAAWMKRTSDNTGVYTYGPTVTVDNNIIGNVGGTGEYSGQCVRTNGNPIYSLKNNIISDCEKGAVVNVNANNAYNIYSNNGQNYFYSTAGIGEITNINPFTNGLKYLPRIESSSYLSTACNNGRCGPDIIKKIGVSGTLYGESGWNTLTEENLWPWKHEGEIKNLMSKYTGVTDSNNNFIAVDGKRGFCSDGNGLYGGPITLTSYIWEYLGNACPSDICNYNIQYHPADTNQNNIIEMRELIAFIARWKNNEVTVNDVISALDRWFKGS